MTSVSSQDSGAKRRPRSVQIRIRIPDKGGSRRKYGTPTARRPYHLFSMGAAAPIARSAPRIVPNGGMTSVSSQDSGAQRRLRGVLSIGHNAIGALQSVAILPESNGYRGDLPKS